MGIDHLLFKTTNPVMAEEMAQACKKGGKEVFALTWGIVKCASTAIGLIEDAVTLDVGALAKEGIIKAVGNKAVQKIDMFMCISDAIGDNPISSDILDCIGSFSALFDE